MTSQSSPPSAEPGGELPAESGRPSLQARALDSLDWQRIIDALAERASTVRGRAECASLELLGSLEEVRAACDDLGEMIGLHRASLAPPLGSIEDLRPQLAGARRGEILSCPDLLRVAHTLQGLGRLHSHCVERALEAPRLATTARAIRPMPDLAAWLLSSFDGQGELSSSTYPQLSSLRSRKSRLHSSIRSTLDALRGEERYTESLQDDFMALRNDRYVVPVKAAQKRAGLGIVHDTSGSGQTVFIEPFEVVELNNDLKMADAELRQEELRILRDLTERLALCGEDLLQGLGAATRLDVLGAKATLAIELDAIVPTVPDEPVIRLVQARHPVLVLRGLDVVANDLVLGGGSPALVLSGPNTGGKTVTLKTLGLAALLVRAGMAVPAAEGSAVGFFPQVLTDIGDAQDVEGDLSTFSGHILCLVEILESLGVGPGPSVVLIDEIAVGTDPVQGAALGRALLLELLESGALLATTTHYPELKALSAGDSRFVSGRVEFDAEEARPTYRLSIGQPGSSHALDVAARVGLSPSILERARSFLDPTGLDVEELLSGLQGELAAAASARADAEADRVAAATELRQSRGERDELKRRIKDVERELRAEFEREVRGYRASVRGSLREIKNKQDERSVERARQRISEGAAAVRERMTETPDTPDPSQLDPAAIEVGSRVRVQSLGKEGSVLLAPDRRGRVAVEVDGLRVQVALSDLAAAVAPQEDRGGARESGRARGGGRSSGPAPAPVAESAGLAGAFRTPDITLDLRGERVDDALERVERFLDDAVMAARSFVFVLHGHGTGALKKAVREVLKRSSYVGSFGPGTRPQGGDGVTVVRLDR